VAKLPANPDKSLAFVEVSVTLQPSKSAVKLGPMELLLPLAIKGGPPIHLSIRADVQVGRGVLRQACFA